MKVKADRDEASPYAAMLAAQDVSERCKVLGVTALHIKLRATGGNRYLNLQANLLKRNNISKCMRPHVSKGMLAALVI